MKMKKIGIVMIGFIFSACATAPDTSLERAPSSQGGVLGENGSESRGPIVLTCNPSDKDGKYVGNYKTDSGQGDLECTPGPAFSSLASAMKNSRKISEKEYRNSQDTILAATCQKTGEKEDSYVLRASHREFGDVSLIVQSAKDRMGGMTNYSELSFGNEGVLVFKNTKTMHVSSDYQTLSRVYVNPKVRLNAQKKKLHQVLVVPDLKDPGKPMIELNCVEAQAYSNIEKFGIEAAQMPKTFPAIPGTMAQQDRSLCGKENYSLARARVAKWKNLIMDMPMPDDALIRGIMMDRDRRKSPNSDQCPLIMINVSTRVGANAIQKILGETLDGISIRFDVGEERRSGNDVE